MNGGEDTDLQGAEGEFDFLGYYVRADVFHVEEGRQGPSGSTAIKKSIKRMVEKVHALTDRSGEKLARDHWRAGGSVEPRATRLGPTTSALARSAEAYRALDSYTAVRLRRWICVPSTRSGDAGAGPIHHSHLYSGHFRGLNRLKARLGHDVPWVKA